MTDAFIRLHISILLAGLTGIFGKLIDLTEGPLVWYRLFMTSILLLAYAGVSKKVPRLPWREALAIGGIGALVALHWLFFYGSIKYANVSIAVVCFALTGFFTAILEPVLSKKRFSVRELSFSLITVVGIALIFHFDARYRIGILLGVICAVFAALFTIATRRMGARYTSMAMLFYELTGGFLFLTAIAPLYLLLFPGIALTPGMADLVYLFFLSSFCTIGMFLLQIQALKHISAFTVNLSYNLEPVYSIVLAMILFNEAAEVNFSFFIGLGLICLSVFLQSIYAMRQRGGV